MRKMHRVPRQGVGDARLMGAIAHQLAEPDVVGHVDGAFGLYAAYVV
jgi:hypothetical protein